MRLNKKLCLVLCAAIALSICALSFIPKQAIAKRFESIAAIVNDEIITYGDVNERMKVIIKSSRLPNTKEFKERIMPQVMDALIVEQIQLQEAKRLGIDIPEEEVQGGFDQIAAQNKIPSDKFMKILEQDGMPIASMARQIRAQIGWGKIVQKEIRPQVNVSDQDVEAEIDRMRVNNGKEEYWLAEIFLPVREAKSKNKVRNFAIGLTEQLKRGASFSSLARQFSASAGAAQGGMIGWMTQNSLDPKIASAVIKMDAGTITNPIETQQGYHIMFLREKRVQSFVDPDDTIYQVKQLVLPLTKDKARNEDAARNVAENLTGCLDIDRKADEWTGGVVKQYDIRASDMKGEFKTLITNSSIGNPLTPLLDGKSTLLVEMVCGKILPEGDALDRGAILRRIGTARMEVLQRGYLHDLQSQAYIENKVQ